ncbi:MAG: acylphosphatase [Asgard group archaeon]|nr:acylphosphatase [Asgard group archaeon]
MTIDEITSLAKIIVKGYVQGVSFRVYTKRKAKELGLTGYVKNLSNGDVEVVAEGKQKQIYKLIIWLRKEGSPASHVEDVLIEWLEKLENYNSFKVIF